QRVLLGVLVAAGPAAEGLLVVGRQEDARLALAALALGGAGVALLLALVAAGDAAGAFLALGGLVVFPCLDGRLALGARVVEDLLEVDRPLAGRRVLGQGGDGLLGRLLGLLLLAGLLLVGW